MEFFSDHVHNLLVSMVIIGFWFRKDLLLNALYFRFAPTAGFYYHQFCHRLLSGFKDLEYSRGGFRPTNYDTVRKLQDIEKCFNYLDGGLTEAVDLEESLKFAEEYGETKKYTVKVFYSYFLQKEYMSYYF